MEGDGQFDDAESGADVPAGARTDVDQSVPDFVGQHAQFIAR
jgi:hypothetical protein